MSKPEWEHHSQSRSAGAGARELKRERQSFKVSFFPFFFFILHRGARSSELGAAVPSSWSSELGDRSCSSKLVELGPALELRARGAWSSELHWSLELRATQFQACGARSLEQCNSKLVEFGAWKSKLQLQARGARSLKL